MGSKTSWVDFYNQLVSKSQATSQFGQATRTNPLAVNLTYAPTAGEIRAAPAPPKDRLDKKTFMGQFPGNPLAGLGLDAAMSPNTIGGRVIDLMSRPLYGVASAIDESNQQQRYRDNQAGIQSYGQISEGPESQGGIGDQLSAFLKGLTGESKTTTRDVIANKSGEESARGVSGFAKSFAGDVAFDPLSWVGPGAAKSAGTALGKAGAKLSGRTARTAATASEVLNAEKASEGLVKTAVDGSVVDEKNLPDFLKQIDRNKQVPGDNVFDSIFAKKPNLTHPSRIPDEPRVFNVGPEGIASETKLLEGPPVDTLVSRARMGYADKLSQGIPQFQYGSWIDNIPETGFYKEVVKRVPDVTDTPFRPPTPNEERAALQSKYKFLEDAGNPDIPNHPVAQIIMKQVDEPVYPRYEPYIAEHTLDSGKTVKWKAWRPNPEDVKDGLGMPMGEVRKQLMDPKTTPARKTRLKSMLANHIRAVNDYAKSGPAGFKHKGGYEDFYREMYGTAPGDVPKGPALPKSPFEDMPKFKEVKEWVKLDEVGKRALLLKFADQGLSDAHITYLAQASNQKSYATRLRNLQNALREGGTKNALDLADAIETGRIQSIEEPGISDLLKHYNVKTLKQLAKAIRKDEGVLRASENKVFKPGKDAVTKDSVPAPAREVGPTGLPYKPYTTKIGKMVEEAKTRAKTNTPAKEIIEKVLQGDKTDLVKPQVEFSFSHQTIFDNGLQRAVDENIIGPKNAKLWKYVTKTGVKRTAKTVNKGRGRVEDSWNKYSQYDFFKGMLGDANRLDSEFKAWAELRGIDPKDMRNARSQFMYNMTMKPMEAMDDLLKQGGIFPVAGTRAGDTPFSLFDALDTLDPSFAQRYVFTLTKTGKGPATSIIAPTQLMDAMNIGVTSLRKGGDTSEGIASLIRDTLMEVVKTRSGKSVPNGLPTIAAKAPSKIDEIVSEVVNSLPELAQRVERNEAARKLWHENQRAGATQEAFDEIARKLESPDINLAKILELSNSVTEDLLPKIQRIRGIDPEDMYYVRSNVNGGMNEFQMPPEVRAAAKRAKVKADNPAKAKEVDMAAAREADEMALRSMEEEGISLKDVATKFERSFAFRFINEIFPHFGNTRLRDIYLKHRSPMQTIAREYQGQIGTLTKKHARADLQAAFSELQTGTWSQNPTILNAQKDLNKAIGMLFDDNPAYSLVGRIGVDPKTLIQHLDQYKVHPKFHPTTENMHNVWREWDTTDPLNLLSQYFAAASRAASKKMLGDHISITFGSNVKKPGYVKVKHNSHSPLVSNMEVDTLYYPEDIAREMRVLDKFMREEALPTYNNTAVGDMLRVYDNVLHRYKSGLTIYRPGHHVRNMVGDEWLSYMAGRFSIDSHTKAFKVMTQMRGRFDDFDALKALMYNEAAPPSIKPDSVVTTVKGEKLTTSRLWREAHSRGILPDYRTLEDLQIGNEADTLGQELSRSRTLSKLPDRVKSPFGGKIHDVAATVSTSRDHAIRMAHFIDYLDGEAKRAKSLNELFDKAATDVRKWHPDGSDLSHVEQRFARRTIMFYSWIRKAIPLIIEGMVMRPGRATLYPKFMYNVAEAQGIDLDSIGNPFPQDQLFPEWISEGNQGPLFKDGQDHYWGINPGVPMMDVLGDYAGNSTGRTIAGSVTPAIGVPAELLSGPQGSVAQDIRTGIPYFDKSDYVDTQIPNANALVGMTGRSPSSLFTQAKGGDSKTPQPDTQRSLLNFLLGMGVLDMSKPGYVKQAKREQTTRQKDQQQARNEETYKRLGLK